jgi:glycosyltransferase involved in cell wall biosynthesis
MQSKLHVLMTVYNEETFLKYAIQSCLPYVTSLTIVEGAYQETIEVGASARSTDRTLAIASQYACQSERVHLIKANEKSDPQQRNVGLKYIKHVYGTDDWLLIIDGDEIYEPITFKMIDILTKKMTLCRAKAAYFKSLTFVNDFQHYCEQEFPRLFKLTPDCQFINDNYMRWGNDASFTLPAVIKAPNIRFFHYSFCKGTERFELKKKWWETRFKQPFHYSWHLNREGQIVDPHHRILQYNGNHPPVMKGHPLLECTKSE